MKKFTLLLAGAAIAMTAAYADHNPAYNGFYLGAGVGMNSTNGKVEGVNLTATTGQAARARTGKHGFAGGVFAGYGMTFAGNGYAGLEAYVDFDSTKIQMLDTSTNGVALAGSEPGRHTLKRKFYYGLNLHLGYLFTKETLGYLILGVQAGKWKLNVERAAAQGAAFGSGFSKSKTRASFVPGLGVRHALTKNTFLKMEWTISFNPKVSTSAAVNGTVDATSSKVTSLTQQTVMLGVGYKF